MPSTMSVKYVHHTGDLDLPISGIKDFLEKESNEAFRTLPIGEWVQRAESIGLDSIVAAYLGNLENNGLIVFPKIVKKVTKV